MHLWHRWMGWTQPFSLPGAVSIVQARKCSYCGKWEFRSVAEGTT